MKKIKDVIDAWLLLILGSTLLSLIFIHEKYPRLNKLISVPFSILCTDTIMNWARKNVKLNPLFPDF